MPTHERARPGGRFAGTDANGHPVAVTEHHIQTTLRLPPSTKAALDAVSALEDRSQSRVAQAAIEAYIGALSNSSRRIVKDLTAARLRDKQR
jgi:hypothetical protein